MEIRDWSRGPVIKRLILVCDVVLPITASVGSSIKRDRPALAHLSTLLLMSPDSSIKALGHALSGSAGTAFATAAVFPLDLVTTRLKAQSALREPSAAAPPHRYRGIIDALVTTYHEEGGFAALYRGLGPDVAKSVIDSFLFFGLYSYLRGRNRHPSVAHELVMGAFAGACTRALTTPISTLVTRMQMTARSDESLRQMLAAVVREDSGILSLWSGYSATAFLALNPSITFFVNRRLAKRILPALEEEDIPVAWVAFLLAALSKATATALTYPFQTARLRLQTSTGQTDKISLAKSNADRETRRPQISHLFMLSRHLLGNSVLGVLFRIIRKEGRRALYDGLQGELFKGFLNHGLTMLMKA
ncbi:peroxisomal adenine nucleotide transporter 1 [Ophiocordyceps camponoti-floridani]|uniref:Peroxisomal adenine nucleotide transporter 1 n=1 Tax=Ophiocordyceps camponoti-floridani TaxID=2030778 RepID=A0A8H4VBZ7_9HYPO|nr:peroxisomal adenine nucleotide transporter 1 [Ophiocordyceps camponoti-floridani]